MAILGRPSGGFDGRIGFTVTSFLAGWRCRNLFFEASLGAGDVRWRHRLARGAVFMRDPEAGARACPPVA